MIIFALLPPRHEPRLDPALRAAVAIADQTAIINQDLDGVTATATADQDSTITQ